MACTSPTPASEPTVLIDSSDEPQFTSPSGEPDQIESEAEPVSIPFRDPPSPDGTAYRLILETSGEHQISHPTDTREQPPLHESQMLELDYRELPTEGAPDRGGAYLLRLEALHYRLLQQNPPAEREIELADDRLRVIGDGGEVGLDLRGAQPEEGLTPRMLLGQILGVLAHDGTGEPWSFQPRGVPPARRFYRELPINQAILYSRLPLPPEPVAPGATWSSVRFPANPVGRLGLEIPVSYLLAGFADLDGVPCAWILIRAELDKKQVKSAAGFTFDRVLATMRGEAWVELATSRLRRMVVADEARAAFTKGSAPGPVEREQLRYRGRLLLELRDAEAPSSETWTDGTPHFGPR